MREGEYISISPTPPRGALIQQIPPPKIPAPLYCRERRPRRSVEQGLAKVRSCGYLYLTASPKASPEVFDKSPLRFDAGRGGAPVSTKLNTDLTKSYSVCRRGCGVLFGFTAYYFNHTSTFNQSPHSRGELKRYPCRHLLRITRHLRWGKSLRSIPPP